MGNCLVWILITIIRKYLSTQKREKKQSKPTPPTHTRCAHTCTPPDHNESEQDKRGTRTPQNRKNTNGQHGESESVLYNNYTKCKQTKFSNQNIHGDTHSLKVNRWGKMSGSW